MQPCGILWIICLWKNTQSQSLSTFRNNVTMLLPHLKTTRQNTTRLWNWKRQCSLNSNWRICQMLEDWRILFDQIIYWWILWQRFEYILLFVSHWKKKEILYNFRCHGWRFQNYWNETKPNGLSKVSLL